MSVSPTHVEMLSSGSASRAMVTVFNDSNSPLPVEAIIRAAAYDEAGTLGTSDTTEDFLVIPPQALIAPGATQNFRIQWLGDPLIESSRSFLFSIQQVPIRLPKSQGTVRLVMAIGVLINVAPPKGQPSLDLVGTGIADNQRGRRQPTITVQNRSAVHALLPQATVRVWSGRWSAVVTPGTLSQKIGIGLVDPGKRRKFILPIELPADIKEVQASIDFKPKR